MPIAFAMFCTAIGSRPPAAMLLEDAKDANTSLAFSRAGAVSSSGMVAISAIAAAPAPTDCDPMKSNVRLLFAIHMLSIAMARWAMRSCFCVTLYAAALLSCALRS